MQQIAGSAKPAEERGEGEAIDGGKATRTAAVRTCAMVGQSGVASVKVSQMEVREASEHRDYAEDETDAEADEIEGVHGHWVRIIGRDVSCGCSW